MAFGIDDALSLATSGVGLTDTIVQIIKRYRRRNHNIDLERLLEEIKITALERIDQTDLALVQLERMLVDKGVELDGSLTDIITNTSFWNPVEQYRLKQIRKSFNILCDSIYSATDDIAALVRCLGETQEMGMSVVESAATKHKLHSEIISARSVRDVIDRLRLELKKQKENLSSV